MGFKVVCGLAGLSLARDLTRLENWLDLNIGLTQTPSPSPYLPIPLIIFFCCPLKIHLLGKQLKATKKRVTKGNVKLKKEDKRQRLQHKPEREDYRALIFIIIVSIRCYISCHLLLSS
jgi:hypothetical protein